MQGAHVVGMNWLACEPKTRARRVCVPSVPSRSPVVPLIGEMSSAEAGGDKGKWIDEIIPTLRKNFPLIKGLVWFDINKEADWRISSSPASEASFTRMANDPYFNPQKFQHEP